MDVIGKKTIYTNFLGFAVLLFTIWTASQWLTIDLRNTFFWWSVQALSLVSLYGISNKAYRPLFLRIWIILIFVSSIYGLYLCSDYYDYRMLISNFMSYSVCLVAITLTDDKSLIPIVNPWYRYGWIFVLVLCLFLNSGEAEDAITKMLSPYMFLAIFYSLLRKKERYIVLFAFVITLTVGLGCRSDVLKFSFCMMLGFILCTKNIKKSFINIIRYTYIFIYALPLILISLGISGKFNVFQIQEEFGLEEIVGGSNDQNLLQDSRTMLYQEVILSSIYHDKVIMGKTPAFGYETDIFEEEYGKGARHSGMRGNTEASCLNVYMHFGIIGSIIYMLVFLCASHRAIWHSSNTYVPMLGVNVAFRWLMGWIEDFTRMDLNTFFLWIMIGICYSPYFRNMSNEDFKCFIQSIVRK